VRKSFHHSLNTKRRLWCAQATRLREIFIAYGCIFLMKAHVCFRLCG